VGWPSKRGNQTELGPRGGENKKYRKELRARGGECKPTKNEGSTKKTYPGIRGQATAVMPRRPRRGSSGRRASGQRGGLHFRMGALFRAREGGGMNFYKGNAKKIWNWRGMRGVRKSRHVATKRQSLSGKETALDRARTVFPWGLLIGSAPKKQKKNLIRKRGKPN